jgi:hypothetical protein
MRALILGDEQMARNLAKGLQHPRVANAATGDLTIHHLDAPLAIVHEEHSTDASRSPIAEPRFSSFSLRL